MLGRLKSWNLWSNVALLMFWMAVTFGTAVVGAHVYYSLTKDRLPKKLVVNPVKVIKVEDKLSGKTKK